jgi:Rrf2 family protein
MRLSARVEYAAIAVLSIACLGERHGPVSLRFICAEQAAPSRFLVHILLQLKRAGIVKSTRGAGGGYVLALPADAITLLDIYLAIEGASECSAPVTAALAAKSRGAAVLTRAWEAASQSRSETLASVTVADLVARTLNVGDSMYYI